jgi:CBS domain-containing protein
MHSVTKILAGKASLPVTVTPETTVYEALNIMAKKNIGSVIVMENNTYLGIVTERDYSRKVILKNKNSTDTPVSEIMSTDLPHLSAKSTIDECMEIMTKNNIRYLPVFNSDNLIGIISMSDIVKQTILVQKQTIDDLNSYIYSH